MSYTTVDSLFTGICDSIRAKTGGTDKIAHTDIPSAIASIATGGSDMPSNMATGTFTLSADDPDGVSITHNLGVAPLIAICFVDNISAAISMSTVGGLYCNGKSAMSIFIDSTYTLTNTTYSVTPFTDITATSMTFKPRTNTYPLRSGWNYRWIIWRYTL